MGLARGPWMRGMAQGLEMPLTWEMELGGLRGVRHAFPVEGIQGQEQLLAVPGLRGGELAALGEPKGLVRGTLTG